MKTNMQKHKPVLNSLTIGKTRVKIKEVHAKSKCENFTVHTCLMSDGKSVGEFATKYVLASILQKKKPQLSELISKSDGIPTEPTKLLSTDHHNST